MIAAARWIAARKVEFAEEVLDEKARLVSLFIVLSCREQRFDHTLVDVEGFVRQQSIGRHLRQQRVGADPTSA